MKRILLLLVFCVLSFLTKAQTSTLNITYNGFTPQAQTSFQFAADKWSHILVSNVPIKVNAYFTVMPAGTLGITLPNGRRDFSGAPLANTWYATSLANSITGTELNAGEYDMDLYLSAFVDWYTDTSGVVPAGQYDLASVVMHELCHGFGFVSLAKKTASEGSIGMLLASDFAPLSTSFPWPQLDTLPSVFDRLLVKSVATPQPLDTFANPSVALGAVLTSNNVFINSPYAVAANNGTLPKVYSPFGFQLGSSISHLNESSFPTGNVNEMMTPNGSPGDANHNPGPITLGILRDIGWNINPDALSLRQVNVQDGFVLFPNPTQDVLMITHQNEYAAMIRIKDLSGRVLMTEKTMNRQQSINVSSLSDGYYLLTIDDGHNVHQSAFVKQ